MKTTEGREIEMGYSIPDMTFTEKRGINENNITEER